MSFRTKLVLEKSLKDLSPHYEVRDDIINVLQFQHINICISINTNLTCYI